MTFDTEYARITKRERPAELELEVAANTVVPLDIRYMRPEEAPRRTPL